MGRPRVALVYDVLYPWVRGGAEKRIWEIARRLPAHGFEPHLFGPRYWDGPRSITREGVWTHGICPPRPLYGPDGQRTVGEALLYARDLLPALLRPSVDLIDCCAFPYFPWYSAYLAAQAKGVPLLTHWPEFWGPYWLNYLGPAKGSIARAIEGAVAHLGGVHLCPSAYTARKLSAASGGSAEVVAVPAGIDAAALARYAAPWADRKGIIYVGRLLRHKRVDDLLGALALLRRSRPEAHLTIVGSGPQEAQLRALADHLGLASAVDFLTNLPEAELYARMGRARALALPSEREGQGMVVAEAQAVGTPPIVAQGPQTAAPDFVRHGIDGLVYPVSDVAALAQGLGGLVSGDGGPHLVPGLARTAQALDWDTAIVPRIATLYHAALNSR